VKFSLGLPPGALSADPATVPASSSFSIKGDTLSYNGDFGYVPNLLSFKRDTATATPVTTLKMTEITVFDLALPKPFMAEQGFNVCITLRVNYLVWFDGVDFQQDSDDAIRQKVLANLPGSFSVTAIELSDD
jgi:hypothetical protein